LESRLIRVCGCDSSAFLPTRSGIPGRNPRLSSRLCVSPRLPPIGDEESSLPMCKNKPAHHFWSRNRISWRDCARRGGAAYSHTKKWLRCGPMNFQTIWDDAGIPGHVLFLCGVTSRFHCRFPGRI